MSKFRRVISASLHRNKKLWLSFFTLFLSYLIYAGLSNYGNINTDPTSALYLLSTIAQSNATMVAIVISLSLVVIQYSASTYSARVVDIFKSDLRLWTLLLSSVSSILVSLFLIRLIKTSSNDSNLESYYILALSLSIIAYISLFFYIFYVLEMMKSSSIIDALSKKIDIKSLSESWYHLPHLSEDIAKDEPRINRINVPLNDEKDPLLPIIDIIRASIERYDYATARYGLNAIVQCFLSNLKQNSLYEKQISEHLFNRTFEVWQLAWNKRDVNFIEMMLFFYFNIGLLCTSYSVPHSGYYPRITNYFPKRALKVLVSIYGILGVHRIEEKRTRDNLLYTIFLSEYYQKTVFKSVVKENDLHKLSIDSIGYIRMVGSSTFIINSETKTNNQIEALESSITELSEILGEVGIEAIKAESKDAVDEVIPALNDIGEESIEENLIHSVPHILKNLYILGKESAKKGEDFEQPSKHIVKCLEELAFKIDDNSKKISNETQNKVLEYYEYIKRNYEGEKRTENSMEELQQKVNNEIENIFDYIYMIGKESVKNNCFDVAKSCIKSLECVQKIFEEDYVYTIRICENIKNVGLEAINEEQNSSSVDEVFSLVEEVIRYLYSIGTLRLGYLFDWGRGENELIDFLNKNYNAALSERSQIDGLGYGDIIEVKENTCSFKLEIVDKNDKEKALIVNGKENKDIKVFRLCDIESIYPSSFSPFLRSDSLKAFKSRTTPNSKAYYTILEMLGKLSDCIFKYPQDSPTDTMIRPLHMMIKCFENFGIMSVHFRKRGSLNKVILSLISIETILSEKRKNSENNKDQDIQIYLDWVASFLSDSLYHLVIECLTHDFIESSIFYQHIDCLIRVEKEYPYKVTMSKDKLESILDLIKESELKESERDEIIKLITENRLKKEKTGTRSKAVRHTPKRRALKRMKNESSDKPM